MSTLICVCARMFVRLCVHVLSDTCAKVCVHTCVGACVRVHVCVCVCGGCLCGACVVWRAWCVLACACVRVRGAYGVCVCSEGGSTDVDRLGTSKKFGASWYFFRRASKQPPISGRVESTMWTWGGNFGGIHPIHFIIKVENEKEERIGEGRSLNVV